MRTTDGITRAAIGAFFALSLVFPISAGPTIRVQLKWFHQFQFAGFYAAVAKGYYAAEGLSVELEEGAPDKAPVAEVLAGKADVGVLDTGIVVERLRGAPLVALGVIFQHDPHVLAAMADSDISSPSDLAGKRVMISADEVSAAAINAMLAAEGVPLDSFTALPHSWNVEDLVAGRVDAMSAYLTDLKRRPERFSFLKPSNYAIDFYGDVLFSSESFVRRDRDLAEAFVRATFRGWEYAMAHEEELADYIIGLPGVEARGLTRKSLVEEARAMEPFIAADIVEPGHMNPRRWERIAETYQSLGLAESLDRMPGFLFDPEGEREGKRILIARFVFSAAILAAALALFFAAKNLLRAAIIRRTSQLVSLNEALEQKVAERTEDLERVNGELRAANSGLASAMDELKIAHDRMLVSSKLVAVGRLMAGISHELNSLLAAMSSSARIEKKHLEGGFDDLIFAASRLGPAETELLREIRSRFYATKGPVILEPARERELRRESRAALRAANFPEADVEAVSGEFLSLGIADMTGRIIPLLRGPGAEGILSVLRGFIGVYCAAAVNERAVDKASRVVSAFRIYAQGGVDEVQGCVPIEASLRSLIDLCFGYVGPGVEFAMDVEKDLAAFTRKEAFNTIAQNILSNALDAIGEIGTIEIIARSDGKDALVSVIDSGPGIPEEVRTRIFAPFFSTKPAAEGIGLGLDIARRLAQENGGDIAFESRPGRTAFTVRLPRAENKGVSA